jgi:ribonuclease P protein component
VWFHCPFVSWTIHPAISLNSGAAHCGPVSLNWSGKLVKNDEKDLPATQSTQKTHPRIHGSDGHSGWTQRAQATPRQRTPSPRDRHPGQAARLTRRRGPASFAPADRLHHSAEFRHLQRHGVRAETAHFVLYAGRFPGDEKSRLGVTVSKRVGISVIRNRIKRRVREAYRLRLRAMLEPGTSLVVIARAGAAELTSDTIGVELKAATLAVAKRR